MNIVISLASCNARQFILQFVQRNWIDAAAAGLKSRKSNFARSKMTRISKGEAGTVSARIIQCAPATTWRNDVFLRDYMA